MTKADFSFDKSREGPDGYPIFYRGKIARWSWVPDDCIDRIVAVYGRVGASTPEWAR